MGEKTLERRTFMADIGKISPLVVTVASNPFPVGQLSGNLNAGQGSTGKPESTQHFTNRGIGQALPGPIHNLKISPADWKLTALW